MNAYASIARQRRDALALGPGDEWIDRCAAELRADDAEVLDLAGCCDWTRFDAALCHSYRTGDWRGFTAALTAQMDVLLRERAKKLAIKRQIENWDDAGDSE